MVLAEKYRPCSLKDIEGQEEATAKLKKFVIDFRRGKKAALLAGPPGGGKTCLALCLAKDLGFEIFELNASDFRNKEVLNERLKQAAEQKSFFAKSKILLVDEIDGLSGDKDRGGVQTLMQLIEETRFPIILTANDIWQQKLNSLRSRCEVIQLKDLHYENVTNILEKISEGENIIAERDVLKNIAIKARGDARAAINDLQVLATEKTINKKDTESLNERDKEETIFNVLRIIFKTGKINSVLINIFDSLNMEINDVFLWIDENLPIEYKGEDLVRAYNALSLADIFRKRIIKQQYWRFLVYENLLLSAGISAAKGNIKKDFTTYKRPSRKLSIWLNNQKQAKKKSISQKIARVTHNSIKQTMKEFPIIEMIIKDNEKVQEQLKLEEEEIAYLRR